jgi:minor extracellular serine protease Vpr
VKSKLLVVPVLVGALVFGVPAVATADSTVNRADDFTKAASSGQISSTVKPRYTDSTAKVDVMVQLSGDPVAVAQAKAGHQLSKNERDTVKSKLRKAQNSITDDITRSGGKVLAQLQSAYNGIRVRIQQSKVSSLASLPGVSGVHAITAKTIDNTVSVPYLGTPQVWQDAGVTGKGVKVAIIDTGIDYTHADFGGTGTAAAYTAAKANADQALASDSTLFGPNAARIKGGYDFVGDDYDADTAGKTTPKPDANPLDCEGHGTHVAGTAAGGGVTSSGTAYTGPYNKATTDVAFKVGPGVAPQADLYALKVFGCTGSTDVVVDAIDWAVDHGMDVINMSLGGTYGRSDDPDSVAASNAVAAGVVVVASSGNSGSSPYITGSPATGQGVVSVAAVDSTSTFPGASVEVGGKTYSAINANGASLPAGAFKVVALADDPDTTENEALGCSTSAYQKAGITTSSSALTIAVVTRGTCARAAKAIYGQEAGADAVLMINNADEYPPYEGEITSNPDTGDASAVTIPFLGVKSSDGDALLAADGDSLTMVATTLDNPSYREVGSFSSAGPANGDSGLSPNVAAPGVSISSAAVGTGSDAQVLSGTSMAAPHVAGVAALGVQAHPTWTANQLASALVSTANPSGVDGYSVTVSGAGLVDPAQLVSTQSFVSGDQYRTNSGKVVEDSLSFGFAEPSVTFSGTKKITITNTGSSPVTYTLTNSASDQSRPATVRFSSNRVRVPARSSVSVAVTLSASAASIGSSLAGDDQFSFYQVSGNVVLTSSSGVLRVPYLLVPRAKANVDAQLLRPQQAQVAVSPSSTASATSTQTLQLTNRGGAVSAYADVYTWGLSDRSDLARNAAGSGYDLRAAGVQSFDTDSGKLLVFAVNNYDRWSNAATDEFDVPIDTNGDGTADYVIFSFDSGAIRAGDFDGTTEVFIANVSTGDTVASGFMAQAPTDSSTILLPVFASDLGLSSTASNFSYTVASYTVEGDSGDEFSTWATYDPWARAIGDGGGADVARNSRETLSIGVNLTNYAAQKPKGLMVVVADNQSGSREALLLGMR